MEKIKIVIDGDISGINSISSSHDIEVYLVSDNVLAKFEPDLIFKENEGHKAFKGEKHSWLKDQGV